MESLKSLAVEFSTVVLQEMLLRYAIRGKNRLSNYFTFYNVDHFLSSSFHYPFNSSMIMYKIKYTKLIWLKFKPIKEAYFENYKKQSFLCNRDDPHLQFLIYRSSLGEKWNLDTNRVWELHLPTWRYYSTLLGLQWNLSSIGLQA